MCIDIFLAKDVDIHSAQVYRAGERNELSSCRSHRHTKIRTQLYITSHDSTWGDS